MTFGDKLLARVLLSSMLFFASLHAWAHSDNDSSPASKWDISQLMQSLAQVKSIQSQFVERKYLSILNAPLESSGTLFYAAPSHLEKRTLLPKPENMILDQDRLTLERKNRRRSLVLQDYPVIWAFVEGIRSTLAGDLQTLSRVYRSSLEGNANQWRLTLVPSESQMQNVVSEIHISGSKNRVAIIEIIEAGGDHSVMNITESTP
jgi:hypothetical protein